MFFEWKIVMQQAAYSATTFISSRKARCLLSVVEVVEKVIWHDLSTPLTVMA